MKMRYTPNQVAWAVDTHILDSRSTVGDLLGAIKAHGCSLHETKYIPFAEVQDYGPYTSADIVVLYGTHGYVSKCKMGFTPGAYGIGQNMNCNFYYPNLPKNSLLNADYIILPFKEVRDNPLRVFDIFKSDCVFIRPVSGFKTFTGFVITIDNVADELSSSMQLTSVQDETLCLISSAKNIKAEFRFLIVNREVVDGSEYRWDNVLDIRHDWDKDCMDMAWKMANHIWQPDSVYICDVALTENGPKIVELNSLACAGLYAMDKHRVVEYISYHAWQEYHGFLD